MPSKKTAKHQYSSKSKCALCNSVMFALGTKSCVELRSRLDPTVCVGCEIVYLREGELMEDKSSGAWDEFHHLCPGCGEPLSAMAEWYPKDGTESYFEEVLLESSGYTGNPSLGPGGDSDLHRIWCNDCDELPVMYYYAGSLLPPLPWGVADSNDLPNHFCVEQYEPKSGQALVDEAIAEYIQHAVNLYPKLLETLDGLMAGYEADTAAGFIPCDDVYHASLKAFWAECNAVKAPTQAREKVKR